jgi:hypothetical protein
MTMSRNLDDLTDRRRVRADESPTVLVVPQEDSDRRAATLNRVNTYLIAFGVFLALFTVAMGALFVVVGNLGEQVAQLDGQIAQLQRTSDENAIKYELNRDRGEKNAANVCVLILTLGQKPTPDCLSPEVMEHYDLAAIEPITPQPG